MACSASKKSTTENTTTTAPVSKTAVGDWAVTVSDTPAGTVETNMVIEQMDNAYKGHINLGETKVVIDNLKVVDNKVSGSFYSADYGVDVYFTMQYDPANDTLSGYLMDSFKATGKRKM
ncbi:MAG: hypothetical protein HC912_08080 [Saprospiraceae bacterium]|nr:hypothetical protein [Saprospiraceae bacterium]